MIIVFRNGTISFPKTFIFYSITSIVITGTRYFNHTFIVLYTGIKDPRRNSKFQRTQWTIVVKRVRVIERVALNSIQGLSFEQIPKRRTTMPHIAPSPKPPLIFERSRLGRTHKRRTSLKNSQGATTLKMKSYHVTVSPMCVITKNQ